MKSPTMITYGALALAIISEVLGSSFLLKSEQFTRIPPLIAMVVCYLFASNMFTHLISSGTIACLACPFCDRQK